MESLYDDAELYDLVAPPSPEMEAFYVGVAAGRSVLDLACGTGRLTLPMARNGAAVTGGDLSDVMLSRARRQARDEGLDVPFLTMDMRDFTLGRQVDCVVIAANSLMHLHSHDDFARCFAAIRRHLAPGGRLVFDLFVPSAWILSRGADERQPVGRFDHANLGAVTVEETIDYDPVTQIARTEWFWSTADRGEFRRTRMDLRQIYPQELPLLLSLGGLRLAERWGDFDRSKMSPATYRQVCVAVA